MINRFMKKIKWEKQKMNFLEIIKDNLTIGQSIRNWSVAGAIKVPEYKLKFISNTYCILENPQTKKEYRILEEDFQFLYRHWNDYKKGNISRPELRDSNRNTTYTICIFHYLDQKGLLLKKSDNSVEEADIRWKQRFQNYCKAFIRFSDAVALANERPLSDLERQGLIQSFEFTQELA